MSAATHVFNPLKWALTFFLVVIGWVIFRAENLHVAWRMYEAMFSFGDWQLSELNRASLTGLQVGTLVVAYLVLAVFGLRQFYRHPLDQKANKTEAIEPTAVVASSGGALAVMPELAMRAALLLLFAASVLKLSAQSYSPFLYFQF
ncbi:hypothetical protein D3C80_1791880 [compost metagenome]